MRTAPRELDRIIPRKRALTVSAATLMLGVSHAATVGFNFRANYCANSVYNGAIVTATAFGVPPNRWENLTPMDSGYNCVAGYFTLSEVINRFSFSEGLNPLPNGTLTISWSAYTGNVSSFGGYSRAGPYYTFVGTPNPGNEQVYWGFLRDGVNFGPGSGPPDFLLWGDNNRPGYSIDLVGLKSLFTNMPFAIQLIAASDSMQFLTNAFIIDATAGSTQSVSFPRTPPVRNVGDTLWTRGIGGGLSTASEALDTDHLQIVGNRAAHGAGFNFASTIAGFILTDAPVISMPPKPVGAFPGDQITLAGAAVGVPPLFYQWRKNGVPLADGTGSEYVLTTNAVLANGGNYDLLVSNLYGQATSSVASVTIDRLSMTSGRNYVLDTSPKASPHDGLSSGVTWLSINSDGAGLNRTGLMWFRAAAQSQISIPGQIDFDSPSGTLLFWMRSAATNPAAIFDRRGLTGLLLTQNTNGTLQIQAANGAADFASKHIVSDLKWHQVALAYDQSSVGQVLLYIDGALDQHLTNMPAWTWQRGQPIEIGRSHDTAWRTYEGLLDDIRFYNRILTNTELASIYSSAAVVDSNALILRLNFDSSPGLGLTLNWRSPEAVLQSADQIEGPYTDWPSAFAPCPVAARPGTKFYRYRGRPQSAIRSNPFLM